MNHRIAVGAGLLALCVLGLGTALAHQVNHSSRSHLHGTSIFHRFLTSSLTYVDEADERPAWRRPAGSVRVHHNAQGRANNQRFMLRAWRLERDTSYHIFAILGEDTNAHYITTFESSRAGTAVLHFKKIGSSQGNGAGHLKFKLPGKLDPVDDIRELVITDEDTNAMLRADLVHPERLHYLVRRELDSTGFEEEAEGVLHLMANHRFARFQLYLGGLVPEADYTIHLNDEAVETFTADEYGRISTRTELVNPGQILEVGTLDLRDADGNVILSTDLSGP